MARQYAPLHTEIWNDETFVGLSASAQRLYLLAISQPNITWTGTVPYTARRWANLASGTTAKHITAAATELATSGLVLLDENTEELWVRSFIKYNAVAQPKLRDAAKREFRGIHSQRIREAALVSYPWLAHDDGHPGGHDDGQEDDVPAEPLELRVGVGVQGQVQEKTPSTENTNTNIELVAWLTGEANRQADAWLAKDPKSIVDRDAWVQTRIRSLSAKHTELPASAKRQLRAACPNPDCIDGFDYGEDVACAQCKDRVSA